jgi:hypothetical protein
MGELWIGLDSRPTFDLATLVWVTTGLQPTFTNWGVLQPRDFNNWMLCTWLETGEPHDYTWQLGTCDFPREVICEYTL